MPAFNHDQLRSCPKSMLRLNAYSLRNALSNEGTVPLRPCWRTGHSMFRKGVNQIEQDQ